MVVTKHFQSIADVMSVIYNVVKRDMVREKRIWLMGGLSTMQRFLCSCHMLLQARDGGRLVSLSPWIRLLALWS